MESLAWIGWLIGFIALCGALGIGLIAWFLDSLDPFNDYCDD